MVPEFPVLFSGKGRRGGVICECEITADEDAVRASLGDPLGSRRDLFRYEQ